MTLDLVNLTPDNPSPGQSLSGPAKYLFYQDVLQGLFDRHVDVETYPEHYKNCYRILSDIAGKHKEYAYIFDSLAKLAHVLDLKCDLGIRLKAAYDKKDLTELKNIAEVECPELLRRIEQFHEAFRIQWFTENKSFGFDIQDIRIGGLKERIRTTIRRIEDYLSDHIERIEELEQERLSLNGDLSPGYHKLTSWQNEWHRMATPSVL